MPRGSVISKVISAAIFIFLEVAAIGLISRTSTLQNIWLNRLSHRIMVSTWGVGENIRYYFQLAGQNEDLARENFELSRQLDYYWNLYPEENAKAVRGREDDIFTYIPAKIIKISRNSQHNYIILNKGYEDGVLPNSGIITNDGVVGIVDAVDKHYSYGLSLMNSKVSVSARIGKEGVVVPLVWNGITADGGLLKNIPMQFEIMPGDTIRTSGISEIFPGDIPLGVTIGSESVDGVVKDASVRLFQDFSSVRFVTISCNPKREEIGQLEKKEEKL